MLLSNVRVGKAHPCVNRLLCKHFSRSLFAPSFFTQSNFRAKTYSANTFRARYEKVPHKSTYSITTLILFIEKALRLLSNRFIQEFEVNWTCAHKITVNKLWNIALFTLCHGLLSHKAEMCLCTRDNRALIASQASCVQRNLIRDHYRLVCKCENHESYVTNYF